MKCDNIGLVAVAFVFAISLVIPILIHFIVGQIRDKHNE